MISIYVVLSLSEIGVSSAKPGAARVVIKSSAASPAVRAVAVAVAPRPPPPQPPAASPQPPHFAPSPPPPPSAGAAAAAAAAAFDAETRQYLTAHARELEVPELNVNPSTPLRERMKIVWNHINKLDVAMPFREPVDLVANPTYKNFVKYPMDLSTIKVAALL